MASNSSLNSDYGKTWGAGSSSSKSSSSGSSSSSKSSSSSSSKSSSSPKSSGGGSSSGNKGYAYTDKYGFSHVVGDYNTAQQYAAPSTGVYDYAGKYGGGYALDNDNNRIALNTPGVIPYGNDVRDKVNTNFTSTGLGGIASPLIPSAPKLNTTTPLIPSATVAASAPKLTPLPTTGGYQSHLSWFGSPQSYAEAIKSKEAAGLTLDDPVAAAAFKRDYASLFSPLIPAAQTQEFQYSKLIPDLPPMPKYDVYTPKAFDAARDYTPPSIGGGDITWLPTNQAIAQFNQNEQNQYNASLNGYNSQYDQWKGQYNIAWQQQQELQRQKEYAAELAAKAKTLETEAKQDAYNQALKRLEATGRVLTDADAKILGMPKGATTLEYQATQYELKKPYYNPNSGGGGSGGSEKQSDWEGAIYSTADYYKSGKDYLADLERYKQPIISKVGVNGYRRLVEDAYNMGTGSKFTPGGNPMFTYENGSPLGTALKNAGAL